MIDRRSGMPFRATLGLFFLTMPAWAGDYPFEEQWHSRDGGAAKDGGGIEQTITLPGDVRLTTVWVSAGTFLMGRYPGEADSSPEEDPQHEVTLTQGFWLGKFEVTKAQWQAVMGTAPWAGQEGVLNDPDSPAVYVSWDDAQAFVAALNDLGQGSFFLPSEAQWEYACRAGTATRFYWGDDPNLVSIGDYAWWSGNGIQASEAYGHVVGLKLPNPWGLYDMSGNVWEWCQDWWGNYSSEPAVDPTGPAVGTQRTGKGGSFYDGPWGIRPADHRSNPPYYTYSTVGFRVAQLGAGPGGVGIVIGGPAPSLTRNGPVTFNVSYTGATNITLTLNDVTLVATGNASAVVSISDSGVSTRVITLSDITGSGTLRLVIAAGTASNDNGEFAASAGPGPSVAVDNTPPGILIGSPSAFFTSTARVSYVLVYSDAAAVNLTAGDVSVVATGTATGTAEVFGGTTTSPSVELSGLSGDGTLAIAVGPGTALDAIGNPAPAAGPGPEVTVDNTPPLITLGAPSPDSTFTGPVDFPVHYAGASSLRLRVSDVILVATGTAAGTVGISGTGLEDRVLTVSSITGRGTLAISLKSGTAADSLGNRALGVGPSPAVNVGPMGLVGDVNEDGFVNALDVQLVVNGVLGLPVEPFKTDVNGDGGTDALDVQAVVNAVLGLA